MSSTIAIEDLRIGMFVMLDGGWLSHPFPLSSFLITREEQLERLRALGVARVRWSPERSQMAVDAVDEGVSPAAGPAGPALAHAVSDAAPTPTRRTPVQEQLDSIRRCERQHAEAGKAWREALACVATRPLDAARQSTQLTRALLDKMLVEDDIAIRLVAGSGDRAASHALNVSLISLLVGRMIGLTEDELLDMGVGALMHDVGKLEVAGRFHHVEDSFRANELGAYRAHVAKGVAVGQRMGLTAGALRVLAQHHEHADGSGFPLKLAGERISTGARVVALVNAYDNLCNPQSRTPPLTPHEAVSVLFAQGRSRYDTVVLNAFIRMMGVYPAGSLVQLTDDRFALVVGVNSSRPLKPQVLVHEPAVPREEALVLALETQPNIGIRRSLPASRLPAAAVHYLDPRPRVSYYFEPLARGRAGEAGQSAELAA